MNGYTSSIVKIFFYQWFMEKQFEWNVSILDEILKFTLYG